MLTVTGLSRPGLEPCAFTVERGECAVLQGPSGSGKTLLLRAMADLDPNEGSVSAGGVERRSVAAPDWRRRVAYLPAEPGWWAERIGGHFPEPRAVAPMLDALGLKSDLMDQLVEAASTGERQRLALVRLLATEPQVLLLDEPTAALDSDATLAVERLIEDRLAAGACAVVVSHDAEQTERLGGARLFMKDGRLGQGAAA